MYRSRQQPSAQPVASMCPPLCHARHRTLAPWCVRMSLPAHHLFAGSYSQMQTLLPPLPMAKRASSGDHATHRAARCSRVITICCRHVSPCYTRLLDIGEAQAYLCAAKQTRMCGAYCLCNSIGDAQHWCRRNHICVLRQFILLQQRPAMHCLHALLIVR